MDRKPSLALAPGSGPNIVTNNGIVATGPSNVVVPIQGLGTDTGSSAPAIKRRSPIACRRCRRMRSKCIHDKAQPPCKACLGAGLSADDCIFPVRGQPDNDREFRHPRMRAEKLSRRDPSNVRRDILDAPVVRTANRSTDEWEHLPPLTDIVDAVNRFTRYYFQLGFIPKQQFPERLLNDRYSVSVFLLESILSISARLSPALALRYGSGMRAAEFFMERAARLAHDEIYQEPTLERCQAFYLLSIAQQGSGLRNKSYINMGVSMRMAALMHLHREETYQMTNPTPDLIIRAESARRTLWMLHSQDQLHSGPYSPVSLAAADITAFLPCDEADFASGRQPPSRAALEDTQPAIEDPALISDPNRSLFASLIQAHHFWGIISRRAVSLAKCSCPWDSTSKFALMVRKLADWERGLPREHLWSALTLKGYKSEGQDLAYLGVTMIPRLCNIVVRRPYLLDIINLRSNPDLDQRKSFFSDLSIELFMNVRQLFDQIVAQFAGRSPDESVGAQMAAFFCPDPRLTRDGPMMLQRTIAILMECKEVWPLASRWVEALDKFTQDPNNPTAEGSMADGKDPNPNPIAAPSITSGSSTSPSPSLYSRARGSFEATPSTLQSPVETMTPITEQNPHPHAQPHAHSHVHTQILPTHFHQNSMPPPDNQAYQHPHQAQQINHHPPQLNTHLYMPPDNPTAAGLGARDGLGMLIEAVDYSGQQAAATQGYGPANGIAFYPETDGFEGEMQFFLQGQSEGQQHDWMQGLVFDGGYG
ncbi:Fc.00g060070.m01.CDS01 [Cosmosporella sp. VM-42]